MNSPGSESFIMRWFSRFGEFLALSLLWLLCCLPVLTIVPACIALYDTVAHCLHGKEDGPYRRFFRTLKAELLPGMGLTLLWGIVFALLLSGYRITTMTGEGTLAAAYSMLYAGTMLIPLSMFLWVIAIQSRFRYNFLELHRTALSYTVIHLPTTAGLLVTLLGSVILTVTIPVFFILIPAICATIQSWLIEKVFVQYMPDEAEDE